MASVDDLLGALAGHGPLTSSALVGHLDVSQPTVSRLLTKAGNRVLRLGRGRATQYAALQMVFDREWSLPLFLVDAAGVISERATLRKLSNGQYHVEAADNAPRWLRGTSESCLFEGLPYFLYDLRPAGFLGRRIARMLARNSDVPADPREWSDRNIGDYLVLHGDDLPGNMVVGSTVARRVSRLLHQSVRNRRTDYPKLAERVLADEAPGSSAAGEQPKFAVHHQKGGHVIVKFSPAATTAEGRRWRDLLRAEHIALTLLRKLGVPAAHTSLHSAGRRLFLESRRFDRVGVSGRIASVSLEMVDAEYVGEGHGWTRVCSGLHGRGLLTPNALEQVTWLETFGEWIGNTDMHLGNLSLRPLEQGFSVHPAYDMLPSSFAPVRGETPSVRLTPPVRTSANEKVWASAGLAAAKYWVALADDKEVSREFRAIARDTSRRWTALLASS